MSLNRPIWKLRDWIDKDKLNYYCLSENEKAIDFLLENPELIEWNLFSRNSNPIAIELLEKNKHKINWSILSYNENAIELLKRNPDKIDWRNLSSNPNAIELLEKNRDKINWSYLSTNPNAIKLLEENPENIRWFYLSSNKNALDLLFKNNSATAVTIASSLNVGIGNTIPGHKLSVQGEIAKYSLTGYDGFFDNVIKYGIPGDFQAGALNTNRWIGLDASITAGAAVSNVLRVRSFSAGNNNNTPVNVAEFRGDQTTYFYGSVGIGTSSPSTLLSVGTVGSRTAANGLTLGGDTIANLYRSAASTIKTAGSLIVNGNLTIPVDFVKDTL